MSLAESFALVVCATVFGGVGYFTGVDGHRVAARWIGGICAFFLSCLMIVVMWQGTFLILLPATLPYLIGLAIGAVRRLLQVDDCGCNHDSKRLE